MWMDLMLACQFVLLILAIISVYDRGASKRGMVVIKHTRYTCCYKYM